MEQDLNTKVNNEVKQFMEKIQAGFDPVTVFTIMLPRILKEQDRDTRHNCAESVLHTTNGTEAHNACMNVNSFIEPTKPKMK